MVKGEKGYIWIFEEIIEIMMTAEIDEKVINQTL